MDIKCRFGIKHSKDWIEYVNYNGDCKHIKLKKMTNRRLQCIDCETIFYRANLCVLAESHQQLGINATIIE